MSKIIISDTSCLIALTNIDRLYILKELFNEICITAQVQQEFGLELPHWITIKQIEDSAVFVSLEDELDMGEASSIALALKQKEALLLIDEKKGRSVAKRLDIKYIGTLALIVDAKKKNVIHSVSSVLIELRKNGFHISDRLFSTIKKLANE